MLLQQQMSEQTLNDLMSTSMTDKSILAVNEALTRFNTYSPLKTTTANLVPQTRTYTKYTLNRTYADILLGKTPPPRIPPGFETNYYPTHIDGEEILWEDRKTCYMSLNKQCGPVWRKIRLCRVPASRVYATAGRSFFESDKVLDNVAMEFCGLSEKSFECHSKALLQKGITGEPIVKGWIAAELKVKIYDVGVAVWKTDPRFGASIDVDIDDDTFGEIKIPEKGIYRKLIEHMEAIKKGFTPPPGFHQHIFNSHYDQMTQSGVITGKKTCMYTVADLEKKEYYTESVPVNYAHWNNVLYPHAVEFYEKYMEPFMVRNGLQRVDPIAIKPVVSSDVNHDPVVKSHT
jgi:hypothetical protein